MSAGAASIQTPLAAVVEDIAVWSGNASGPILRVLGHFHPSSGATDRSDSLVHNRVGHSDEPHPHRPRPTPVRTLPPAFRDGRQSPERERDHDPANEIGGIEGLVWVVPVGEGRASRARFCTGDEVAHGSWSRGREEMRGKHLGWSRLYVGRISGGCFSMQLGDDSPVIGDDHGCVPLITISLPNSGDETSGFIL